MTVKDELGALLDSDSASCFVCFGNDDGKVLRAKERGNRVLDGVKSGLEPFCCLCEVRKIVDLSDTQSTRLKYLIVGAHLRRRLGM